MTEKGKEECQYLTTDILKVIGLQNQAISPETKLCLIKNHQPEAEFNFPSQAMQGQCREGRRKAMVMFQGLVQNVRYLVDRWIFLIVLRFFPMPAHQGQRVKQLISTPYHNWKNARTCQRLQSPVPP